MAWLSISAYALDFKPGSTGIVYFKTGDGVGRKTPELQPDVFNAVCHVLAIGSAHFENDQKVFRNSAYQRAELIEKTHGFNREDFADIENFETWEL